MPIDLVIDQLIAHDGHGMFLSPFFNYAYGDLASPTRRTCIPAPAWVSPTPAPTAA